MRKKCELHIKMYQENVKKKSFNLLTKLYINIILL